MVDIQQVRNNSDAFRQAIIDKGSDCDLDKVLKLDSNRRQLISQIEAKRSERNLITKNKDNSPEVGRQLRSEIIRLEEELRQTQSDYDDHLSLVPNLPSDDTPKGSEDNNIILRQVNPLPKFDFKPKPHWEMTGFIDQERATKISGSRFAFIIGDLVLLQFALIRYGIDLLVDESFIKEVVEENKLNLPTTPFIPVLPPTIMRTEAYKATGRLMPAEVTFKLANDDLWLTGSAEHALCSFFKDTALDLEKLPIRLLGYNTAYRREVGSAGKDTRGILRQHQFDKLEMESFIDPDRGLAEHYLMIAIQEKLHRLLELPFQTVIKATEDMGQPNIRGVDIEVYLPGQSAYRETNSADYIGDFQARGLKTTIKGADKVNKFVHTNDATVFCGRHLIAILENNQQADGTIEVPAVLQSYLNGRKYLKPVCL